MGCGDSLPGCCVQWGGRGARPMWRTGNNDTGWGGRLGIRGSPQLQPPRGRQCCGDLEGHKCCSLCLRRWCHLILPSASEMGIVIPGLQIRTLRSRKITHHVALKYQGENDPSCPSKASTLSAVQNQRNILEGKSAGLKVVLKLLNQLCGSLRLGKGVAQWELRRWQEYRLVWSHWKSLKLSSQLEAALLHIPTVTPQLNSSTSETPLTNYCCVLAGHVQKLWQHCYSKSKSRKNSNTHWQESEWTYRGTLYSRENGWATAFLSARMNLRNVTLS